MEIWFRRYRDFIIRASYQGFLNRPKRFTLSGAEPDRNGMACVLLKNNDALFGGPVLPGSVRLS